ncbi:TetR family transcriptional regulator C-terminal domain-containing protein [Aquibium sp. ELW1220]|uniref:TetR family transcriptional regulator C-terminal domain-containing protein n=1 Tax=Aquibium sp. ELW1220 TaxID=2976766 RepID=UPI0025B0EB50|nr:TetR family transcriptional regulator C-terminal domain-containing protein [Aquibium sp. ELW1220]MDN2583537.1 TetR family transcriptional regulator C-terminal domain-containing protein [Aquibium sp. ELW1220]
MAERRKFRREGEERRRQDLIEATLDCVAENGIEGATVRAIALRAGVTAGLIRHYFPAKEDLLQAAYATIVERMTAQALASLDGTGKTPAARLGAFVAANLTAPIVDARVFSLWAGFIGRAHADPALSAVHRDGYIGFRDRLEHLIAETFASAGRTADAGRLRRHAIAVNAIIDGLWIEGCMAGDLFETGELAAIGIASVERVLGIDMGGENA